MDYVLESSYSQFIRENELNRIKMEAYIEECLIIAEGTNVIPKLRALNEDIGDKIKEGWNKFTKFIQRIWAKFVENMTRLFNNDHGYLERYKDIILGKKIKDDVSYDMPAYNIGVQRIASITVPEFNSGILQQINDQDDTDIRFKKTIIHDYDGKTEWKDFCNAYFKGAEKETPPTQGSAINMTDLYNFCRDSSKVIANIEKNEKTLINAARLAEQEMKKLLSDINDGTVKPTNQPAPKNTINVSSQDQVKEAVYSTVFESYILEGVTINDGKKSTGNPNATTNTATANASSGTSSIKANSSNNIDKSASAEPQQQKVNNVSKEKEESLNKKMSAYQSTCSLVLGAKMNAVDAIHKAYMTIIKHHVSSYVGDDKAADNVIAKSGTDYSKTNKLPQLSDSNKTALTNAIKDAEQEQDENTKKDKQADIVQAAKTISKNFKGSYEDAKSWAGYQD